MSIAISPYLAFPGTCREAMTAYQRVFGGELTLSTFGDMGMDGDHANFIMHARLATPDGLLLMASDYGPGQPVPGSESNISVAVGGDDAERLRTCFADLAETGTVTMPLAKQVWGDEFGQLTDAHHVKWMFNVSGTN